MILVLLRNYPSIQILTLLFLSFMTQIYQIKCKPYIQNYKNHVSLFNEFAISCFLYTSLALTEINSFETYRTLAGWALVAILSLTVLGNGMVFLV